jgi:tRNA-splicing ligase RtcB (3'-phosphate/5'-hydroxy nucleic acid ligase)
MASAANFAWANRQIIMSKIEETLMNVLRMSRSDLGFDLIYDVCHNIAKFEDHDIDGVSQRVCVHRKGATRAFGPGSSSLAARYRETGQPVIIPGDMGTESYLCVGTEVAMEQTFGSSCHGAGRVMSRNKARKSGNLQRIMSDLKAKNIHVLAASNRTLLEETSRAYKDVSAVVDTMAEAGIVRKIVRTTPLGVIKG